MHSRKKWTIVLSLLAAVAAAGDTVARKPIKEFYNSHQLAFFADTTSVEFVRPGLTITVNSASIVSNGTITTTFTLTDPSGLPLDEAGVTTPGTIALSFLAATIPHGQEQYTNYITHAVTGTVIPTTNQPTSDSGGTTTQVGPGQYTYTYKTLAPGFDPTATSTIGIYGSRFESCDYARRDPGRKLRRLPRSAFGPWRLAARHGDLRHVPSAPEHRSEYRKPSRHEGYGA
jgi:hypothetical protein